MSRSLLRAAPRLYLLVWGSALVVLGVGSLLVHPDFGTGDAVSGEHLFGVFETNGWHGLAGLLAGVVSLVSAAANRRTREVTLGIALLAGIVPAVAFLVSGDDSAAFGLVPVDAADAITLHLIPGLVGLACLAAGDATRDRVAPSPVEPA